jgi:hypothetical protein
MPVLSGIFLVVYFCVMVGLTIFILALLVRFVNSHERLASAIERIAANQSRDKPLS